MRVSGGLAAMMMMGAKKEEEKAERKMKDGLCSSTHTRKKTKLASSLRFLKGEHA